MRTVCRGLSSLILTLDPLFVNVEQYRGSVFKVAQFNRWSVVVDGSKFVDEFRKRSDELSFDEGVEEVRSPTYSQRLLHGLIVLADPAIEAHYITRVKRRPVSRRDHP